jgi:F-type H+-transporting ATPase subunit b
MGEILGQLVALLVGSVPTIVLFIVLLAAYRLLVHAPLQRILAERRARTSGAVEKAKVAISAAEARTSDYEHKLREARVALMRAREARILLWQQERDAALDHARVITRERVNASLKDIEQSADTAREQIQAISGELAAQVAQAVLPSAGRAQ